MLATVIGARTFNPTRNRGSVHIENDTKRPIANQRPHHLALTVETRPVRRFRCRLSRSRRSRKTGPAHPPVGQRMNGVDVLPVRRCLSRKNCGL